MMPKNKNTLDNEYSKCTARKKYVQIPKETYINYLKEAYSDISSAEEDIDKSPKWAIIKAYQALFLMCNALLIRKTGFYSKDHSCILIALKHENIIPDNILENISEYLKDKDINFFEEVSNIRITRNKYLYLPETQRKMNVSAKGFVSEIKILIEMMGDSE